MVGFFKNGESCFVEAVEKKYPLLRVLHKEGLTVGDAITSLVLLPLWLLVEPATFRLAGKAAKNG